MSQTTIEIEKKSFPTWEAFQYNNKTIEIISVVERCQDSIEVTINYSNEIDLYKLGVESGKKLIDRIVLKSGKKIEPWEKYVQVNK